MASPGAIAASVARGFLPLQSLRLDRDLKQGPLLPHNPHAEVPVRAQAHHAHALSLPLLRRVGKYNLHTVSLNPSSKFASSQPLSISIPPSSTPRDSFVSNRLIPPVFGTHKNFPRLSFYACAARTRLPVYCERWFAATDSSHLSRAPTRLFVPPPIDYHGAAAPLTPSAVERCLCLSLRSRLFLYLLQGSLSPELGSLVAGD